MCVCAQNLEDRPTERCLVSRASRVLLSAFRKNERYRAAKSSRRKKWTRSRARDKHVSILSLFLSLRGRVPPKRFFFFCAFEYFPRRAVRQSYKMRRRWSEALFHRTEGSLAWMKRSIGSISRGASNDNNNNNTNDDAFIIRRGSSSTSSSTKSTSSTATFPFSPVQSKHYASILERTIFQPWSRKFIDSVPMPLSGE